MLGFPGLAWALSGLLFSMCFLTSSCYPFFVDFDPNLGPTWPPTWPQNRPKINPRAIPNRSHLVSCFRSPFGLDFNRFLIDFWPQKSSENRSTNHHNNTTIKNKNIFLKKNYLFLQYIRALGYVKL